MRNGSLPSADRFGKVAVVLGGWSAEREVSLMSGEQVHKALLSEGVNAHAVDADKNIANVLVKEKFDRAFLILHGRGGEDGHVQGALELIDMPYTGSGVLGSALAMDKFRSKSLCREHGVPTAEAYLVTNLEDANQAVDAIGLPVVIKPTLEGSSLGVSMVNGSQQIAPAYNEAAKYGPVMVEKRLLGREVTAAVLGQQCLPLVSMKASGEFYDYEAKYLADDTVYQCPAELDEELTKSIQQHALTAFNALSCAGWGRIDFMLDEHDQPYFVECNTAPGMTSHSLVPIAAKQCDISFESLCMRILADTLTAKEMAA